MVDRQYVVYILTNARHTVLYTGVTNDLQRRIEEHKRRNGSRITGKYKASQLVYYEIGDDIRQAICREKQIKAGSRKDKLDLIHRFNPEWKDLSSDLFSQTTQVGLPLREAEALARTVQGHEAISIYAYVGTLALP
jgi:putative endonuclease